MRTTNQYCRTLLLFFYTCFSLAFSSDMLAETPVDKAPTCESKGIAPDSQECITFLKRIRLQSVKLSPEIRKENIKRDRELNVNALYPFIGGAGGVN